MQTTSVTYNHVWLVSRQKSDMTLQLKIVFHYLNVLLNKVEKQHFIH